MVLSQFEMQHSRVSYVTITLSTLQRSYKKIYNIHRGCSNKGKRTFNNKTTLN